MSVQMRFELCIGDKWSTVDWNLLVQIYQGLRTEFDHTSDWLQQCKIREENATGRHEFSFVQYGFWFDEYLAVGCTVCYC